MEPCNLCTPKVIKHFRGVFDFVKKYFNKERFLTMEMNELQTLRHSASHVLAQAVKRLFPETKLAIGPAIDTGFY